MVDRLAPNALAEEASMICRIHNMKNGSPIETVATESYAKGDGRKPKVKKKKI